MGAGQPRRPPQVGPRALSEARQDDPDVEARVARVLPDRPGINKTFDYTVPSTMAARVQPGALVRVDLHGRRVGAWVVADPVEPPGDLVLKPIAKVSSVGPPVEVIDLASWAAWRWAGAPAHFLRTASPERNVTAVGSSRRVQPRHAEQARVVRLSPTTSPYDLIAERAAPGGLVLVPSLVTARRLVRKLRRDGVTDASLYPDDWGRARTGSFTVGTRSAAWAPLPQLSSLILIDEHDEVWQQEAAPTWHARDVLIERGRRAGVETTLVSPAPTLEALALGALVTGSRDEERAGWPRVEVVDRRDDAPGAGMLTDAVARLVRGEGRVVCVLNRKGRSRLLACASCGELARCEVCQSAVAQGEASEELVCARCGTRRPLVCLHCGAGKFRNLRAGVARLREELEALARKPVVEITADSDAEIGESAIFIGTEAVLHRVPRADAVVFLDFDQELLAPRYRAAEEALTLLIRAARVVGPRSGGGRVVVQTRLPRHEAIQTALHGDPDRLVAREEVRRELLHYPPFAAVAVVSGVAAPPFMEAFGQPGDVEVLGPADGEWMLRASTHPPLLDALAATPRPTGRLRVAVDPLRI